MRFASPFDEHRRKFLAGLAVMAAAPSAVAAPARPVVTVLGDSITAGLGLPAAQALPAQLQAALNRLRTPAVVRAAGVSGDTTAGGLARLSFSVRPDTRVCVVALGANDGLRGLEPRRMQANLNEIVKRLKARRIGVVLCGLRAPLSLNARYARDFNAAFAAVARANGVLLLPDMLAGVWGVARLNQSDGIHPNAQGARIIAERMAPVVARALRG